MSGGAVFETVAPLSFMGVPLVAHIPAEARAVIAGLPFDAGQHPVRVGSRLGPRGVRAQSALLRAIDPETDLDVTRALGLVDLGDVPIVHGDVEASQQAIHRAGRGLFASQAVPVTVGGDGSVTLPLLHAAAERHPGLAVIHLDAHTDTYPLPGNGGPVCFHRATEAGWLDPSATFHIGLRGPVSMPGLFAHARALGHTLVTMDALLERGIGPCFDDLAARLGQRPVYVCWDMDFFDPSVAPGVFTPSWGGATVREGLAIARRLATLNLVALDINTVSPLHDTADTTAFLCARVIYEFLRTLAARATPPSQPLGSFHE